MFDLWKLKWRLWRIRRTTAKETEKLKTRKAPHYDFQQLDWDEQYAVQDAEKYFDFKEGQRLRKQAVALDVELPPTTDLPMWFDDTGESGFMWLTSKGRAHVRKLVDQEKERRFNVKTLWVTKFWLPLLAAIVGIIGALTGFFAVMHRDHNQPEKKPPVYEQLIQVRALLRHMK
jgi:uncharacterized protein YneF (UPF0154 family)